MQYFAGLDLHKEFIQAVVVNSQGKKVKEVKFMNNTQALDAFLNSVSPETEFALEACSMYEPVYDWIDDRNFGVTLCHPKKVKAIASAKIKTDLIDATTIAQLKRCNLLPESFVPAKHIREVRNIVRHRASLVRHRARIKNVIQSLLLKEGVKHPFSDLFGKAGLEFLKKVPLKYSNRLALENYLAILSSMTEKIEIAAANIDAVVDSTPKVKLLTTMPGIGKYTALLIASEIAEIKRFPSAEHLCSFAGLVPSLHQSGMELRRGHITKEGNKLLRWALVQSAHKAVEADPHLKKIYTKLKQKKGSNIATVAVARKMLSYIYIMLTQNLEYNQLKVVSGGKARE